MESSKKILLSTIGIAILIVLLSGMTFAFFNYTRTGIANSIRVGRIRFNTSQDGNINLTNIFPITSGEATGENPNYDEVIIEIDGDTDYNEGIEYLVSVTDANIYTTTGQAVPISLDIIVDELGIENTNYFVSRESKDATIYKKLIGDTLVEDDMLLVGYIAPNDPTGTAEGIDGSITIKAYIDKDKVKISDTYDGTESDNMGTTNEWAEGKTVITTSEWNALQNTGISFKIKVEANEGIWVENQDILYIIVKRNAIMDNINSKYVDNNQAGIDFIANISDTNGKGKYIRLGTENTVYPIVYYRGDIDNNNIKFANKCWKMVRTTDTGGVKLLYNGEYTNENKCNNTGTSSIITVDVDGTPTNKFKYNSGGDSPAYIGYMYGDVYTMMRQSSVSGYYFGSSFSWDGENYHLVGAQLGIDSTHHYSCASSNKDDSCETINYYFYRNSRYFYYITLTNNESIDDAIEKMNTNNNDSLIKEVIDDWYLSNLYDYRNELEDTIWCNDRTIFGESGWSEDGDINKVLYYGAFSRFSSLVPSPPRGYPSLTCMNINDSFTVSNSNGNRKLTYPIALLDSDEVLLAGLGNSYLNTSPYFWLLSPTQIIYDFGYYVKSTVSIFNGSIGSGLNAPIDAEYGIRPAISIKYGTVVSSGIGTMSDPYVIE